VSTTPGWYPDPWTPGSLRWWTGTEWTAHSAPEPARDRSNASLVLVASAAAWSVFLLVLAVVLPVYTVNSDHPGVQPMHSLIRVFGYRVLGLVAIPLVVSIAVGVLLRVRNLTEWQWPSAVAWTLSGASLLAAFVGTVTFLVGIWVLPVGLALCIACYSESVGRSRHRVSAAP
jgi:Protein of unknown function (DUF2510)